MGKQCSITQIVFATCTDEVSGFMDSSLFFFHVWLGFILIYNYFQHDFLNIYFLFHYLIISSLKSSKIDKVTNMSMGLHLNLLKSIKVEEPSFRLLLLVVVAAVATFFLLLSSNIRPSPHSFFEKPMKHLFLLLPFPYLIQILSNIISFVYPCHF
jgi:hypothetical protein